MKGTMKRVTYSYGVRTPIQNLEVLREFRLYHLMPKNEVLGNFLAKLWPIMGHNLWPKI